MFHDILDESRPATLWNVPQLALVCFSEVFFLLHKLLYWVLTGCRKLSPSLVVEGLANSPTPCFGALLTTRLRHGLSARGVWILLVINYSPYIQ